MPEIEEKIGEKSRDELASGNFRRFFDLDQPQSKGNQNENQKIGERTEDGLPKDTQNNRAL